jgi:hypothetical protein
VFTLPNSLSIIKKYKKQNGGKDEKELNGGPSGLLMLNQNGG